MLLSYDYSVSSFEPLVAYNTRITCILQNTIIIQIKFIVQYIIVYTGAVPLTSLTQSSSFPIHYNSLNCTGEETSVYDCTQLKETDCPSNKPAIVACQNGKCNYVIVTCIIHPTSLMHQPSVLVIINLIIIYM